MIENHIIASEELAKVRDKFLAFAVQCEAEASEITQSPLVHVPSVHYRLAQIRSACQAAQEILGNISEWT